MFNSSLHMQLIYKIGKIWMKAYQMIIFLLHEINNILLSYFLHDFFSNILILPNNLKFDFVLMSHKV